MVSMERKKLSTILFSLAGIHFIFVLLFALEVIYGYGGLWWAFYAGCAYVNLGFTFRGDRLERRKVAAAFAGLGAGFALMAFLASCAWAASQNVENGAAWKPPFALSATGAACLIAFVNFKGLEPENLEEKSAVVAYNENGPDVEKVPKASPDFKTCCKSCCVCFLFVLVALASVHTLMLTREKLQFYPEDESSLYEIEGHTLFARCSGSGSPAIFFNHGLGGNSLDFTWIMRDLAADYRVCAFDRPGYGQSSERGPGPRTSMQIAEETKILFDQLGLGEAIFVGHSFAGFNMRVYHSEYPDDILGMVFVDAVTPNNTESCDPNERYPSPLYQAGLALMETGVFRLFTGFLYAFSGIEGLPDDIEDEYFANIWKTNYHRTRVDEFLVWGKSCSAVDALQTEDEFDIPITHVYPVNGIFEDELEFAEDFARLSENSTLVVESDPDATHVGILFEEQYAVLVITAVRDMISDLGL